MKDLFVPYELALKLKEKGFDEPCLFYYSGNDGEDMTLYTYSPHYSIDNWSRNKNSVGKSYMISAPLYQQVIDWLFGITGMVIVYNPADIESVNKEIVQWLDKLESTK